VDKSICIRADASTASGSGHVVRASVLATALRDALWQVSFACRTLSGHMNDWLRGQGFTVHDLQPDLADPAADAAATLAALPARPAWIAVDHYGLDARWESAVAATGAHVLVQDDLGRAHHCDVLLDQNLPNPLHARYLGAARTLLGPRYALIRPAFPALREAALARRAGQLERVLVTMGGSDPSNETLKVVQALGMLARPLAADIVIGSANPHRAILAQACARLPGATLHVQTDEMPRLMLEADLALGAGGGTSWERCCLGLPTLCTVLSDDQDAPSAALAATGAQRVLGQGAALTPTDYARALDALDPETLRGMAAAAATICDGQGARHVAAQLDLAHI